MKEARTGEEREREREKVEDRYKRYMEERDIERYIEIKRECGSQDIKGNSFPPALYFIFCAAENFLGMQALGLPINIMQSRGGMRRDDDVGVNSVADAQRNIIPFVNLGDGMYI